jgi:hypothetical protein
MSQFEIDDGEVLKAVPERIVLYGPPGVGKTSWASQSPNPFFLDLDKGTMWLKKVGRNKKKIETWNDLLGWVRYLHDSEHDYKTLVLDTVDRAEALCHEHVISTVGGKNKVAVKTLAEVGGGYGQGYNAAAEEFRRLWAELERLWENRGMRIIIIAHCKLTTVQNPGGFDYQRYSLKVHEKVAGLLMEVSDAVLFASQKISVSKNGLFDEKRARAMTGDARYLHASEEAYFVAKNRLGLPPKFILSWDEFVAQASQSDALLKDTIKDRAAKIDALKGDTKASVWIASKLDSDRSTLISYLSTLNGKLDELQTKNAENTESSEASS